jgi:hypothetical protein
VDVIDYEWVRMPTALRLDQMRMVDGKVVMIMLHHLRIG